MEIPLKEQDGYQFFLYNIYKISKQKIISLDLLLGR